MTTITSECIARAFGVDWVLNEEARQRLAAGYANPADLNTARLRMAHIPAGRRADRQPGIARAGLSDRQRLRHGRRAERHAGNVDGIKHRLSGGAPVLSRTVTSGLPEGVLADGLGRLQERYPDFDIGSYPYYRRGGYGTSLVVRGTDRTRLAAAADDLFALVTALGGEPYEGDPPA